MKKFAIAFCCFDVAVMIGAMIIPLPERQMGFVLGLGICSLIPWLMLLLLGDGQRAQRVAPVQPPPPAPATPRRVTVLAPERAALPQPATCAALADSGDSANMIDASWRVVRPARVEVRRD